MLCLMWCDLDNKGWSASRRSDDGDEDRIQACGDEIPGDDRAADAAGTEHRCDRAAMFSGHGAAVQSLSTANHPLTPVTATLSHPPSSTPGGQTYDGRPGDDGVDLYRHGHRPRAVDPVQASLSSTSGVGLTATTSRPTSRLTDIEILERVFPLQRRRDLDLALVGCDGDLARAIEQLLQKDDALIDDARRRRHPYQSSPQHRQAIKADGDCSRSATRDGDGGGGADRSPVAGASLQDGFAARYRCFSSTSSQMHAAFVQPLPPPERLSAGLLRLNSPYYSPRVAGALLGNTALAGPQPPPSPQPPAAPAGLPALSSHTPLELLDRGWLLSGFRPPVATNHFLFGHQRHRMMRVPPAACTLSDGSLAASHYRQVMRAVAAAAAIACQEPPPGAMAAAAVAGMEPVTRSPWRPAAEESQAL